MPYLFPDNANEVAEAAAGRGVRNARRAVPSRPRSCVARRLPRRFLSAAPRLQGLTVGETRDAMTASPSQLLGGNISSVLWRSASEIATMSQVHAKPARAADKREPAWEVAYLVMEVVSGGQKDRHRDLVTKRREYARAGIPEYWIVDPQEERITVLRLAGKRYLVQGEFARGATAPSHLLPGFTVDVSEALAQQARPAAPAKT